MTRSNLWLSASVIGLISSCVIALGTAGVAAKGGSLDTETRDIKQADASDQDSADDAQPFVAKVNGEAISEEELAAFTQENERKKALDALVNLKIIEQACKEQGIVITEQDVEQEVRSTAEKFGLSVTAFYELVASERNLTIDRYHRESVWPTVALNRLSDDEEPAAVFARLVAAARVEYSPSASPRLNPSTDVNLQPSLESVDQEEPSSSNRGRVSPTSGRIAVLNLKRVFEEAQDFQASLKAFRSQVNAAEAEIQRQRSEITSLNEALDAIPSDNREARTPLERIILEKKTNLEKTQTELRQSILRKEAMIYVKSYSEVQDVIREYAQANGIELVVRINGDEDKGSITTSHDIESDEDANPTEVIKRINQPIIYAATAEDGSDDITDEVIQFLNDSSRLERRSK